MDQKVSALRFARAALPRYNNALVDSLAQHSIVRDICNGKNVGLQFAQLMVLVHLDILGIVDGKELERVDGNKDAASICVDLLLLETAVQVGQDSVLVENGKVAEVVEVLVAWRQKASSDQVLSILLSADGRKVSIADGAIVIAFLQDKVESLAL